MVLEGELLWKPGVQFAQRSQISRYIRWLRDERQQDFPGYQELWRWSTTDLEGFWSSLWDYFGVLSDRPYDRVLNYHARQGHAMQGTKWFEGARVNYAEHLLRHEGEAGERTVFHHMSETRALGRMSWNELGRQVRIVATQLRALGVVPGDRVASYMPNTPETAVAMIATTAIGAVWSSSAPEFGSSTVIERFAQIEPKVLFAADGYRFGGRDFDRLAEVRQIVAALPGLQNLIWLQYLHEAGPLPEMANAISWAQLLQRADVSREEFRYERVAHDHPLWILFSSGTTGLPKAIVHGHVGALIEHLKVIHLHMNLSPESAMFFYSTTGWMMWNVLIAALLAGSAAVLYDGNPAHPGPDFLWQLAARTGATCFGASPTYVQLMEKAGLVPADRFDLRRLESIVISGAPSTPETFDWFYRRVKRDLWVTSQSGGTELCSAFVGACPTLPVYAGEIQARMLGMAVHAWDDNGVEVSDAVGELVVTCPFPSMPLYFWNDADGSRYRESYFDVFPGVWRHGDYIRINARGGCYIYGRSDSTLNRHGVRIGTAEIYRCVEQLDELADSLIVCCELPGGRWLMPMFVRLKPGLLLDEALRERICNRLRNDCSPRHVPDELHQVEAIPYTLTGKKMEVPVRKLLLGQPLAQAANRDAMMNPSALDWFVAFRERHPALQFHNDPS